ncbi:MAG: hypothetical protein WD273_05200 [Trueperaceae bacterium]
MAGSNRETDTAAGALAQAGQMNIPLKLVTAPPLQLWEELAVEARTYIDLLERLKMTPLDAPGRHELEKELMSSLSHLQVHSLVLEEGVIDSLELTDDLADSNDD